MERTRPYFVGNLFGTQHTLLYVVREHELPKLKEEGLKLNVKLPVFQFEIQTIDTFVRVSYQREIGMRLNSIESRIEFSFQV